MECVDAVGLMLSRRQVQAGERLNLMLIAINAGSCEVEKDFVVYLQRSDCPGDMWTLAAQQRVSCAVGTATHVYFSLHPVCMAVAQGYARWIRPCEFLVWAACAEPSTNGCLPPVEGITDIFSVEGSCQI